METVFKVMCVAITIFYSLLSLLLLLFLGYLLGGGKDAGRS